MQQQVFATPKFPSSTKSLHAELKRRVNEYLEQNQIKATGNFKLFSKAILLVSLLVVTYIHLVFYTPSTFFAILECVVFGGLIAAIGFNVMWGMKHVTIHHTYTNIDGVDDDIEVGVFMRMAPTQKYYSMHRFQHIYFWFLYMLLYIFWIFFADYKKYFSKKIGNISFKSMSWAEHIEFWSVKIYHVVAFVVLPIYMVGWVSWLVGFLIATMFAGFILSIVFQLAHTVEDTEFPIASQPDNKMPDEFAAHQIQTTANFATKNKLVSWLVGGLNFQIEHHLFPKISHVHYPAISKIVKQACEDFKLNYIEYPTVLSAIKAHFNFVKQMSKPSVA
jgi:linoleoyl-CoA desaturase